MEESILNTIKIFLGLSTDDDVFDEELIILINAVIMALQQI